MWMDSQGLAQATSLLGRRPSTTPCTGGLVGLGWSGWV